MREREKGGGRGREEKCIRLEMQILEKTLAVHTVKLKEKLSRFHV